MSLQDRKRLVVIGSGWAGLYIAQHINTRIYDVTIVSPQSTCALTPLLASAACGIIPFSCAEESIRAKNRNCTFIKAEASSVDFDKKVVHCQALSKANGSPFEVRYDYLIVCPGCRVHTFGVQGVEEHALFIKHVEDAVTLRKTLFRRLEEANLPNVSDEDRKRLLHIAIVDGGPTGMSSSIVQRLVATLLVDKKIAGVEVTAELYDLAQRELRDMYPAVAQYLHISIYDVAEHILGSYERELYNYATEQLRARHVDVVTQAIIEKVDEQSLHIKNRSPVPYGILLWVVGNRSVPFVDQLHVKKNPHGLRRILTDSGLRVKRSDDNDEVFDNIFALGDAADIEDNSLPTTAEVAVQKARFLVLHLNQRSQSSPSNPSVFEYRQKKLVTYIGGHDGIMQGWSAKNRYAGTEAWLSWRSGTFTWSRTWRSWFVAGWALLTNAMFGKDPMGM